MSTSIFAKPYFIGTDNEAPGGPFNYLFRATSLIRGEQMAQFLGAKFNPTSGFDDDLCIYLKPRSLNNIRDGSYIDISDAGEELVDELKKRPKLKAITSSLVSYELVKKTLANELHLILEHHCNFERVVRKKKTVKVAGFLGTPRSLTYPVEEIRKRLEKLGIKFITNFSYKGRQDVVDFYKQIDLHIVWYDSENSPFKHPGKIVNAAAYGVPTITNPRAGYKEFEGYYISVDSIDLMMKEAEKLKDTAYYDMWSEKVLNKSEEYHIENIAKLYRNLK